MGEIVKRRERELWTEWVEGNQGYNKNGEDWYMFTLFTYQVQSVENFRSSNNIW